MAQELYELPVGWERKKFKDVCLLKRGYDLPTRLRVEGKHPLYSANGVTDNIDQYKIKGPGVITGRSGTIGKVHYVEDDYWPLNTALYVQDFYGNNPRFIKYFLQNFDLTRFSSGAAVPTLNRNSLSDELVCLPKQFEEQQRLVKKLDALLSRIDTAIEHLEHSLELNDQLFASSLNQAFNPLGAEIQSDGTYQLPEGWEWHSIEDVARVGAERGFVPDIDENDMAVFVSMADIDQDTGLNSSYERRAFETIKTGYTKFQKNAVLLAKITPCTENNKTALVMHESGGYATTEVYPIHANEKLTPHYLLHFLRSSTPRKLLISKMEGATGRQRVPTKAVKEIMMPVCPLGKQAKINKFISAMQEKTQNNKQVLQQKLEQLQQLKASLLDSAFRGEL